MLHMEAKAFFFFKKKPIEKIKSMPNGSWAVNKEERRYLADVSLHFSSYLWGSWQRRLQKVAATQGKLKFRCKYTNFTFWFSQLFKGLTFNHTPSVGKFWGLKLGERFLS